MTDKKIIELLKKHGIEVELGSTYSVRCQIAQIINAIKEISAPSVREQPVVSLPLNEYEQMKQRLISLDNFINDMEDKIKKNHHNKNYNSLVWDWIQQLKAV